VNSGENASVKCHQVRRKQDAGASFLRHFWLMSMRQYTVRLQTDFAEETLDGRGAPSTAHARGAVNDDCARWVNDASDYQWTEREND
jgi:hypothetical protein